jgi:hypothetical protein
MMKFKNKSFILLTMLVLTAAFMLPSCQWKSTDDYEITIVIMGSGSQTATNEYNKFNATILVDDKPPLSVGSLLSNLKYANSNTFFLFPVGKIKTATITATRANADSTLTIMVYKDNKLDEKGVGLLSTCNASSPTITCSNTLNLVYKVDQKDTDKTKGAAASSTTTSSTSTTSSSSTP